MAGSGSAAKHHATERHAANEPAHFICFILLIRSALIRGARASETHRPLAVVLFNVSALQLSIALALLTLGQGPPPQTPSIRVPVRLVSIPTLVASQDGKYIAGLTASIFI